MSADKRSVSTDALATLGTIIESGDRDAIHLAVMPIVASEALRPAQHIGIKDGKATAHADKMLGIVDPFLTKNVEEGQKFWLIVYPRQITSLRHVWSHPDFEDQKIDKLVQAESELWLRNWCEINDVPSYDHVVAAVMGEMFDSPDEESWGRSGYVVDKDADDHFPEGYITFLGRDAHCSIPPEFWVHLKNVTGKDPVNKVSYFSCSC